MWKSQISLSGMQDFFFYKSNILKHYMNTLFLFHLSTVKSTETIFSIAYLHHIWYKCML